MEKDSTHLIFNDQEQETTKLPPRIPITDAENVRARVEAQRTATNYHMVEVSTDPLHGSHGAVQQLQTRVEFLGGMINQLDELIATSVSAGIDEEFKDLTGGEPTN